MITKTFMVSTRMDDDLLTQLDATASQSGIPRSTIIRIAVSEFLALLNSTDSPASSFWRRFFRIMESGVNLDGSETD